MTQNPRLHYSHACPLVALPIVGQDASVCRIESSGTGKPSLPLGTSYFLHPACCTSESRTAVPLHRLAVKLSVRIRFGKNRDREMHRSASIAVHLCRARSSLHPVTTRALPFRGGPLKTSVISAGRCLKQRTMSSTAPLATSTLVSSSCEPCKRGTPALAESEHSAYLGQLASGWRIEPFPGSGQLGVLRKTFTFKNFKYALQFVHAVGQIAEADKHHPEILFGWGHVEVAWWTHAIGGVGALRCGDLLCSLYSPLLSA